MELSTNPIFSSILHHGDQTRKDVNDHQAPPIGADAKLQIGKAPKTISKPTRTISRPSLPLIVGQS